MRLIGVLAILCALGATLAAEELRVAAGGRMVAPSVTTLRSSTDSDPKALDEILGGSGVASRWPQPPRLVVLRSVMQYDGLHDVYTATPDTLTEKDAGDIERDLTDALALLTAGAFPSFSSISEEVVAPGASASVYRRGEIVVGRYRGLRASLDAVGYGSRIQSTAGTVIKGTILLDEEYDRTNLLRRSLVRTHELGHTLGYHHVESRLSIMNPQIGAAPTAFDRWAAAIAFANPSPDTPRH